MKFRVVDSRYGLSAAPRSCVLVRSDWDDWFRYETTYSLLYIDTDRTYHDIGTVKIAAFGMGPGHGRSMVPKMKSIRRSPDLPDTFSALPASKYFSLGQDADYYERLNRLGPETRDEILRALNDIALLDDIRERALSERVTSTSLLRYVSLATVEGQFRRIALGGARLSDYKFTYIPSPTGKLDTPVHLDFEVVPESHPPSNIHVLIGRNGVGKTRLLNHMSLALVAGEAKPDDVGDFIFDGEGPEARFSSLVSVSFSAFDSVDPLKSRKGAPTKYVYVGLKRLPTASDESPSPKTPANFAREFSMSVASCLQGERHVRWRRALKLLESDPVFADANVADLAALEGDDEELRSNAVEVFRNLSSGHKIVLLTITRLVESVEERSLVLLDEPEAHLHPPLLAALVRALSDLLINRNGVALIATHSPVVLQEVPSTCAWILHRSGRALVTSRPRIETFGENVGLLTHEVFGLEVTKSGFHRMLSEAVDEDADYEEVVGRFKGQLGGEARGIVRALIAIRDAAADPDA